MSESQYHVCYEHCASCSKMFQPQFMSTPRPFNTLHEISKTVQPHCHVQPLNSLGSSTCKLHVDIWIHMGDALKLL